MTLPTTRIHVLKNMIVPSSIPNHWTAEASSLGWLAGFWPNKIDLVRDDQTPAITLTRGTQLTHGGAEPEFAGYFYQGDGATLTVFND